MTSTELEKSGIMNISPFAYGDAGTSVLPYEDAEGVVDIKNGFKQSSYPVEKVDMNGAFQVATRNQSFENRGGLYTFDSSFCTAIGGYPKGCVLYQYNGVYVLFVESLVDNNTWNYHTNGIDNIHWRICSDTNIEDIIQAKDIDWDARKLTNIYTFGTTDKLYSYNSTTFITTGLFSSGRFNSKGYVVVSVNNAQFHYNGSSYATYAAPFQISMIVSSDDGTNIDNIHPYDVIKNPITSSVNAFPVQLMSGYYAGHSYYATNQIQVQKNSNFKLFAGILRSGGTDDANWYFLDSGTINIYFLPTPD